MDLIFTNPSREDVGVLHNYELDLAFGSDENNLECVVSQKDHCCTFGSYLYIEGTEYGGIVDSIKSKNSTAEVVYSGRTWHGILNSKVLQPDSGEAHLVLSGEANEVIASLLTRMGLSDLFEASSENSGLNINSYKMNRYISGYEGILKMLKTVGAKLLFCVQNSGKVLLSVVPVVDYTKEELNSDLIDLDVKKTANTVNHLICLGPGELENRMVFHLYADADGNISQTQTFQGIDECVAVFDYSNAEDEADLINSGTERLKELMQQDDLSVDVNDVDDPYDIGDIVGATDNITSIKITVPVTKKIVTIKNGAVTIDIKTETGNLSEAKNESPSGGSGLPGADGQDGQDGKDGVSCTHEWKGTVLTVTSASGTSSADLKGEKGETGSVGPQGPQGPKGDPGEGKGDMLSTVYDPQGKAQDVFAGNFDCVGKDGYIAYPDGGHLSLSANASGRLKITLPVTGDTGAMLRFTVKCYSYYYNFSFDYVIDGFLSGGWSGRYGAKCVTLSKGGLANLPVSFCVNGTERYVLIGYANTNWMYTQIAITDVVVGVSSTDYEKWKSGWKVEVTTEAIPSGSYTVTNTNVRNGLTAADVGAPTVDEMNTAIETAISGLGGGGGEAMTVEQIRSICT